MTSINDDTQKEGFEAEAQEKQTHLESSPHEKYYLATEGAITKNGGIIHVKARHEYISIENNRVAMVGDYAQYPDGTTATIISGGGCSILIDNIAVAISQSVLDNGDVIEEVGLLNKYLELTLYNDQPIPEGFLIKNWMFLEDNNETILHS